MWEKMYKKYMVFLSGFSWKKFLVNGSKKKDKNFFLRFNVFIVLGKFDNNLNIDYLNRNILKLLLFYDIKLGIDENVLLRKMLEKFEKIIISFVKCIII